ncbi:MAG: energy transducer TonB [Candidatus Obscuribacter sp.]|nr:energy transducer TonB [Candidatus Obscuribacter sp.]
MDRKHKLSKRSSLKALASAVLMLYAAGAPLEAQDAYGVPIEKNYRELMQAKIGERWRPQERATWKELVIEMQVDGEGNIQNQKLVTSSGLPEVDQEAMQVLRRCEPFGRLPAKDAADVFNLHFLNQPALSKPQKPLKPANPTWMRRLWWRLAGSPGFVRHEPTEPMEEKEGAAWKVIITPFSI